MSTSRQARLPDSRQQEYVDTGSSASAWLSERTDASSSRVTLEWDFSQLDTKDVNLGWSPESERLHVGDSELPTTNAGRTQLQTLYSSARCLDNNYSAASIPNECLIEPLLEASKLSSTDLGDALSLCRFPSARLDRPSSSYLLTFPSGRSRNKLTALCLDSYDTKRNDTSKKQQILAFSPTPIEQISSISEIDGILVGIRNATSVILYRIGIRPEQDDNQAKLSCQVLASFIERSFLHARPLHFCLQHFSDSTPVSSKALIIDDTGSIWQTASSRDLKKAAARYNDHLFPGLDKLRHGNHSAHSLTFARISYGCNERQAVAVLSTCVRLFDLQDPSGDRRLFDLAEGKSSIRDMANVPTGAQECPIRVIVTDQHVIWLDIRKAVNPVLRYKQRREGATGLRLSSVCDGDIFRTILWSTGDSIMTLFSMAMSAPMQLLHAPYDLREASSSSPGNGLALLPPDRRNRYNKPRNRSIQAAFQLANGTIIHKKLEAKQDAPGGQTSDLGMSVPVPPAGLDIKQAWIRDISKIYRSSFFTGPSLSERSSLPTSLKLDDSISVQDQTHVLLSTLLSTSCDDDGSEHTAVANFTGVSALDRAAIALESLQQDANSLQQLEQPPFRFDVGDSLNQLEACKGPDSLAKTLRGRYGLKSGIYVVKHRDVQESHLFACEQLAMDLSLSKIIFAPTSPLQPLTEPANDIDLSAYKDVSELPPVEYGYFKPSPRPGVSKYSAAAQALLCEWSLGADPSARPAYANPYDKTEELQKPDVQLDAYRLRLAEGADISASQPLPGLSRVAAPARRLRAMEEVQQDRQEHMQSQLAVPALPQTQTQTQTQQASQAIPMPFSQVVPGPHGGRPAKKKRVGGFYTVSAFRGLQRTCIHVECW